jgi:tRNA A-37 threonylcarbamoyl transferase component Bud32
MTTTRTTQIYPDYYTTSEEASSRKEKNQTNSRYKGFNQTHFTAGDEDQFEQYRYLEDMSPSHTQPIITDNIFSKLKLYIWDGYKDINLDTIDNTFRYIFHKFKKGIFVKIKDGELKVFLPFSKANYVNEWSGQIKGIKDGKFISMIEKITKAEGHRFNPHRVNENIDEWYGNNCLIRYEYPLNEGDSNVDNIKNMLEELCQERKIPDTEFFINRRDFPLLTRNGMEPYHNIWDTDSKKLVSHSYDKYVPILSMSTANRFADIAIPTHNDWARVQSSQGKWFPKSVGVCDDKSFASWDDKVECAVFRGASTGTGVTIETNMRLKASKISLTTDLVDAGITKWNLRPRKIEGNAYLQTIDTENIGFGLVGFMTIEEQAKHKYILHIDGHVSAFRMSNELATGSLMLLVESQWKLWYSDMLQPYVHYVPVSYDLSNLIEIVQWCKDNDEICKNIAINAKKFYDNVLNRDSILDYMQKVVLDITKTMNTPSYPPKKPIDEMLEAEEEFVRNEQKIYNSIYETQPVSRTHKLLSIVHEKVKKVLTKSKFEEHAERGEHIFSNKLSRVIGCKFTGLKMAIKCTNDKKKMKEYIHEAFIGTMAVNKLLENIPNFAYTFGTYKTGDTKKLITEFIPGQTLFEYINSDKFKFSEFRIIMMQLTLALQMAQREHGFIHNDVTPWNIIIYRPTSVTTIDYLVDNDRVVTIKSKVIPVLIDFGKSKIIHNDVHHDFLIPNQKSLIHDILTMILTTVKVIISTRRPHEEFVKCLELVNHFSGTRYLPIPIRTMKDLNIFLKHNAKYAELMSNPKYEIENMNPMYFFKIFKNHVYTTESNLFVPYMQQF